MRASACNAFSVACGQSRSAGATPCGLPFLPRFAVNPPRPPGKQEVPSRTRGGLLVGVTADRPAQGACRAVNQNAVGNSSSASSLQFKFPGRHANGQSISARIGDVEPEGHCIEQRTSGRLRLALPEIRSDMKHDLVFS